MASSLEKIWFVIRNRVRGSRVSPSCYIKNPARIELGTRVKIHSQSSLDASSTGAHSYRLRRDNQPVCLCHGFAWWCVDRPWQRAQQFCTDQRCWRRNDRRARSDRARSAVNLLRALHSDSNTAIADQEYIYQPIVIEDDVWIGANSVILAGVTIGSGSLIGAGAVVTRSCEPYSVLVRVPARLLKKRGSDCR